MTTKKTRPANQYRGQGRKPKFTMPSKKLQARIPEILELPIKQYIERVSKPYLKKTNAE